LRANFARWLLFAAIPWLLMFGGFFVWWPSGYLSQPLFIPLSAYAGPPGGTAALSWDKYGVAANIGYSWVLAAVTVYLSRNQSVTAAIGVFAALTLLCSLAVHALMYALGFQFWYDAP
jgi:hypothetical protein